MTANVKLRLLLSAYACGPGRGSEPGIGWNAVTAVAHDHDVWVMTSLENRESIVEALASTPGSVQFVFLDWPKWLWFMKSGRVSFEVQQYCWQMMAYLKARALHREIRFDLVHHATVGRYWMPSFLAFLGIPFVWGPVGGGESAPKSFWPGLGIGGALLEVFRATARFFGERDPFLRLAARRTTVGIATSPETSARMRALRVPRILVWSHVALTESEVATLEDLPPPARNGTVRFFSVGRLVSWKGFHLGLEAFARMQHRSAEYWIVGDGPVRASLQALAVRLNVADRVRFLGALPRAEVLQTLAQSDVLVHPSLHESGGFVCAEAMAAGRPVVCLDLGGPGMLVTTETGFKIPARTQPQAIADLAVAMDRLVESPAERLAMGTAARARVREHFNTRVLREHFRRWYAEAMGRTPQGEATREQNVERPQGRVVQEVPRVQESPTVSVIMPTYNKGPWLQQAIDSVLHQTFRDWELIIVDDGSTDETPSVLARYCDPRIRIHTLDENVGRGRARNVALARARGRYIAVCDSDDISAPTRFEEHVAYLDAHPEISVVSSHMRLLSENRLAQRIVFPIGHEAIARRFARGKMGVAHGASMIRAECFQQLGGYCEDLRAAEDFELFRRFATAYRFETLPKDLLLYRSELGAVPFPTWTAASRAHRYALYRSKCHSRSIPPLTFDAFVGSWRTNLLVYSVDSLRFAHFNLRAHVFSSHVLR
jgi:glycosyltransferase involved in cell wall biosynthesis/GT2 family glycosyltransferase